MCKDDIRVFIVPGKSVSVNNFGQFPGLSVFIMHTKFSFTQVRITQTIFGHRTILFVVVLCVVNSTTQVKKVSDNSAAEVAKAWESILERGIWAYFILSTIAIVVLLETIFLNHGCALQ